MKVIANKRDNTKTFGELKIGDIFLDIEDSGYYCMKIESFHDTEDDSIYNAFAFDANTLYAFGADERVEVCKGYLVIE